MFAKLGQCLKRVLNNIVGGILCIMGGVASGEAETRFVCRVSKRQDISGMSVGGFQLPFMAGASTNRKILYHG